MKRSKILIYLLISVLVNYLLVADVLFFTYTITGVWTSRTIWGVWFIVSLYLAVKNWKWHSVRFFTVTTLVLPLFVAPFLGILGGPLFLRLMNADFEQRLKSDSYQIYLYTSAFSGKFFVLFEDSFLVKKNISSSSFMLDTGNPNFKMDMVRIIEENGQEVIVEIISDAEKIRITFERE